MQVINKCWPKDKADIPGLPNGLTKNKGEASYVITLLHPI